MLEPGAKARSGFFGWFEADKQTATSSDDAKRIDAAIALPEANPPIWPNTAGGSRPAGSLFSSAPLLESLPLG